MIETESAHEPRQLRHKTFLRDLGENVFIYELYQYGRVHIYFAGVSQQNGPFLWDKR